MNLSQYIRELRITNQLSQRDLAKASGISSPEICRIESGIRKNPSPVVLRALAPHLKISYEELLHTAGYIDDPRITTQLCENVTEIERTEVNDFLKRATAMYDKDPEWALLSCAISELGFSERELSIFKAQNRTLFQEFAKIKLEAQIEEAKNSIKKETS